MSQGTRLFEDVSYNLEIDLYEQAPYTFFTVSCKRCDSHLSYHEDGNTAVR